ncbi:MAG: beta-ketoacyl-[acyl-carrier-protein] synthase family protein [Myxococcota bacterium]
MSDFGSRSPCSLTALGIVNALGRGAEEIWPRLLAGDQSHLRVNVDLVPNRTLVVGEVVGDLPAVPDSLRRYACRNNAMTLAALEQIEDELRDAIAAAGPDRIGVVVGTSTSGVHDAELAISHQHRTGALSPRFSYEQLEFGGAAGFIADLFGLGGPAYTVSTACSSGARALASAKSLLALGLCDVVIAGGSDTLCGLTTNGFSALQLVSDEVTNPCSRNRKGLTLGEGSALFVLVREEGGIQLSGVGESSEAHHMSAPDPEGVGAEQAMRSALLDASLEPEAIAYVNLHGTGTQLNDAMECSAVARVFPNPPPCSSSKPLVGHTLGAAGAIEAGFCWIMLREQGRDGIALIPHAYDGEADPAIPSLPLATKGMHTAPGPLMTNVFGFGGNNCTLILEGRPG